MLGILLAKMRDCSWEDRADDVLAMRRYTRELHKDVRSNERVMKSMWGFVENVKTPFADPYEGWEAPGADEGPKKKVTGKRKRNDEGDPDEGYRSSQVKGTVRTLKTRSKLENESLLSGVRFVA